MSRRSDAELLEDIKSAIENITEYTAGMSYEGFIEDRKTQDAVTRNLEIIGEAAKNVSGPFKSKHARIPWKNLAAVRDKLIHNYFGVNYEVVWEILDKHLPEVLELIRSKGTRNHGD